MLTEMMSDRDLLTALQPGTAWCTYPRLADREFWKSLDAEDCGSLIGLAEATLEQPWPAIPATRWLDFARDGNRTRHQELHFGRRARLVDLVLAECLKAEGRFLDEIANGIWVICEETFWGVSAHVWTEHGPGLPDVEDIGIDLFSAETAAMMAWIDYLLGDRLDDVSPLFRKRLRYEVDRRMLTPALERDDFGWMGTAGPPLNNWTPWIVSNWLASLLLQETDADRRTAAVAKCLVILDRFLAQYPEDGGCDEGPGYWGRAAASLFDCLDLLKMATNGAFDGFHLQLVKNMGAFIHRTQISDQWVVNFADASPLGKGRGGPLVYRFGKAIGDREMMAFGARGAAGKRALPSSGPHNISLGRVLPDLMVQEEMGEVDGYNPLPASVWLPDTEVALARDTTGTVDGFCFAAKGGHNAESHNHNDVGQIVAYLDGDPLLIDIGVETYSRKTFSPERYTIWTMQSAYHNLPTVNGIQQAPGREFQAADVAFADDGRGARFSLDLAAAWPPEAKLNAWRRTIELTRGESLRILDEWELAEITAPLDLHLITASPVTVDGDILRLQARDLPGTRRSAIGTIDFSGLACEVIIDQLDVTDDPLRGIWGDHLWSTTLRLADPQLTGRAELRIRR